MKFIKTFESFNSKFTTKNTDWKNFRYDDQHIGYQHGQHDCKIFMYDEKDELLAKAYYSIFQEKIHISFIESIIKNKGYGAMIMYYLADKYGYENLERSSLTDDGAKMRSRLDNDFNFDHKEYEKSLSKLFSIDIIDQIKTKHPIVAQFLKDMIKYGYDKTWENWGDYLRENDYLNKYDFNDISELSKWFKDSVTNEYDFNEEPPLHVQEDLNKLLV